MREPVEGEGKEVCRAAGEQEGGQEGAAEWGATEEVDGGCCVSWARAAVDAQPCGHYLSQGLRSGDQPRRSSPAGSEMGAGWRVTSDWQLLSKAYLVSQEVSKVHIKQCISNSACQAVHIKQCISSSAGHHSFVHNKQQCRASLICS